MTNELIEIKQLPSIVEKIVEQLPAIMEQLHRIKAEIEAKIKAVLDMECTEETVKEIKKQRADLGKLFKEYEAARKEIHELLEAPYDEFLPVYKECISIPFKEADELLATRITYITDILLQRKLDDVFAFAREYVTSIGLTEEDCPIEQIPIKATQSSSIKSLKETVKEYANKIREDLLTISQLENPDEIMIEYRVHHDLPKAIITVANRKRAIEQEIAKREAMVNQSKAEKEHEETVAKAVEESEKEAEGINPPTVSEAPVEVPVTVDRYSVSFTVTATLDQLKALKEFLNNGGYEYANN